jgi:hypothetical protein
MGNRQSVQREVEIARSPEQVRHVLMDFAKWPEWNSGMKVSVLEPSKALAQLLPGDKLKSDLDGRVMYPIVLVS